MENKVVEVEYSYSLRNEPSISSSIAEMEKEIGGTRKPYFIRAGAFDLVSLVQIGVVFIVATSMKTVLGKYFEGFYGTDSIKDLGAAHRAKIDSWLIELKDNIAKITVEIINSFDMNQDLAITLNIPLEERDLVVVLNHAQMTEVGLAKLPAGVISAIDALVEMDLGESPLVQLYFDEKTQDWNYLFTPTSVGYGSHIDRFIDIQDRSFSYIDSAEEFLSIFEVSPEDSRKLIISPFDREP